jgi:hypothetical protein
MVEHIKRLAWIGILRSVLSVALGLLLLVKADRLKQSAYGYTQVTVETVAFDKLAFRCVGVLCLFLASLRMVQAAAALVGQSWARTFGLALAIFDILNLCLFPISTTLGLYGLVVYRHADTLDYFEKRRGTGAAG